MLFLLALVADPSLIVRAHVEDDLSRVQVSIDGSIGSDQSILFLADWFAAEPQTRPETVRELFPSGFSSGGFTNVEVRIDGQPVETERRELRDRMFALKPTRAGRLTVSATLRVPERFGAFGHIDRALTLAGAWFPVIAREIDPPERFDAELRVSVPPESFTIVGTTPFVARRDRREVVAIAQGVRSVPLILRAPTARVVPLGLDAIAARFVRGPTSRSDDARAEALELALRDGVTFLQLHGLTSPEPLVIVEAPLRHDLVESGEGVLFVSDRAFRMTPVSRFQKFHRLPILRGLFAHAVRARLRETSSYPRLTRKVAADFVANALLERYVAWRLGGTEDAFDVLGPFAFIPSIDSMLYAPDLPFVTAYFRMVREDDPLRFDFEDAPASLPPGKLLFEKSIDRFGLESVQRIVDDVLVSGSATSGLEKLFDHQESLARFLDTWLGPHPGSSLSLVSSGSTQSAAVWKAEAVIDAHTPGSGDPIEVRFTDDDGNVSLQRGWPKGGTERLSVTATLSAPLDLVEVDPRARVFQVPTGDDPSPRFDDRSSANWKLILNNFNLLISATEGQVDSAIDLGFSKRYEVHEGFGLRASLSPESIGVATRYRRSFGSMVTPARLAESLVLTLGGEYLRPGFVEGAEEGAAATASLSYVYDDRVSVWAPQSGTAFRASAGYSHVFGLEPGSDLTADSVSLAIRGLAQWRIGLRNELSLRGALGGFVFGRPREQLAFTLGGRGNARGYAGSAVPSRYRALVSGEWLHPLVPEAEIDAFSLFFANGIDGAFFADAAVASNELDQVFDGPVYGDVGYGLRVYFDYAGVRPAVMAIDVAFPLTRPPSGSWVPAVYIDFAQSFTAF